MATNTISSSITVSNAELNNSLLYSWPIYINGGTFENPTVVTFGDDITLDNVNKYFIIDSDYIRIDGNNFEVTIVNVSNWYGLIQNGNSVINNNSTHGNVSIKNINIGTSGTSSLSNGSGWICQMFYGGYKSQNEIINCSSSGNIQISGGGIIGQKSGGYGGHLIIKNCYSTGNITSTAGGIIGTEACPCNGQEDGTVEITDCYSTGNIEERGGGIIGSGNSGLRNVGNIIISNCYSSGTIKSGAGGIAGEQFGRTQTGSLCSISNCYSTGNIIETNAGGIVGIQCAYGINSSYTTNVSITNCYSLGTVISTAGSIVGGANTSYPNASNANLTVSHCYSLYPDIISPNFSTSGAQLIQTNNFVETSTNIWDDGNASLFLTGTPTYVSGNLSNPIGSTWADISALSSSIPWVFSTFFYSPYTTVKLNTFGESVNQGLTSSAPVIPGSHTYTIVAIDNFVPTNYPTITINSSTGIISVDKKAPIGTYYLKILQQSDYTMTTFILSVLEEKSSYITIENKIFDYCVKIKKNDNLIINLNDYPESNLIVKYIFLKYPKNGSVKITKCNRLIYTPDRDYVGKDKFIISFDNIIPQFNQTIKFIIKIKK